MCITCAKSITSCSSCSQDGSKCFKCTDNLFASNDGSKCDICSNLITSCQTCSQDNGKLACTACIADHELSGDVCVESSGSSTIIIICVVIGVVVALGVGTYYDI